MARAKREQQFEYRMKRLLEEKGWTCFNVATSRPVDLVAIKDGETVLVEFKAKKTRYPVEQRKMQSELVAKCNVAFALIRQSEKRGKVHVEMSSVTLLKDLEGFLLHKF